VGVLKGALTQREVTKARAKVLDNLSLMKNTRPTPSARHLAGFHRYPTLEPLQALITGNAGIRSIMTRLGGMDARIFGLSDITVNRSQPWHKDLLRGQYRPPAGRSVQLFTLSRQCFQGAGLPAVILDICTTHRGSHQSAFESDEVAANPRILVSTVFGRANCALTDQMEAGNTVRLADWQRRWGNGQYA
jgi:hypothetical protein